MDLPGSYLVHSLGKLLFIELVIVDTFETLLPKVGLF